MKLTIIKTLINNELSFEKIQASIIEISEQINGKNNFNLIILLEENSGIKDLVEKEIEKLNMENINIKYITNEYTAGDAEQLITELDSDYIMILNGGDKLDANSLRKIEETIKDEELVYLNYFAPDYKITSKYEMLAKGTSNIYNSNVIWEHVNNKIISRDLIINNKLDVSSALNDSDKQTLYVSAFLCAERKNVFYDYTYLKLQGNDDEYEMFEEYDDLEYFENIKKVFDLIDDSNLLTEEKAKVKASFFTYELFEGQNADKLQDTNKEEDAVKQKYLEKLAEFLWDNDVEKWSKNLSLEAQGIVRVINTKNLVNVANKLNLLLIYKEFENHKAKTDKYLEELENRKVKQEEKVKNLLNELQLFEEKIGDFNNKFSEVELRNIELNKMLKLKETEINDVLRKTQCVEEKVEEYKVKLIQAKELFTQQEEENTNLKGKINKQKVLVQERDIEISRINLELEYLKNALEENEKVIITDTKTKLESVDKLKSEKDDLENKYQLLAEQYQELQEKVDHQSELNSSSEVELIKQRCAKLERENKILRNGYDDLAEELKLNRNIFKGIFKK